MQDFEDINHILKLDIHLVIVPITALCNAWFKVSNRGVLFGGLFVYIY